MRATIYTRISKDLRQRAGVERQLAECEQLCADRGYTVVSRHEDNDISAFSGKPRPGYESMLKEIERGGVDVVVCWHTDRLYRRPKDLETLIDLCESKQISVETVNAGGLDLSTSSGRLIARQLAIFSGYEVEHQIERQKAAHDSRAAQGRFRGGKIPFGFIRGDEPGTLKHHPIQAPALRKAARDLINGRTAMSIAREWVQTGVVVVDGTTRNKWGAAHVRRRLTNPKIAGFEHHHGELFKATGWEPIVDESTWRVVCGILKDPKRNVSHTQERRWLGSGLFICGNCGSKLGTVKRAKKRSPATRSYFCYSCTKLSRSMLKVDAVVVGVVLSYLERERLHVLSSIREATEDGESLEQLQMKRQAAESRKAELARLFAKGVLSGAQLEAGTAEIDKEINGISSKIGKLQADSPTAMLLSFDDLRKGWEGLTVDQQSLVISELVEVTIMPTERRGGDLDPNEIKIEWR